MYKIIIAEDEEDVRNAIMQRVNESNTPFRVTGAARDGIEALQMVKELRPDILITDICMPKLDGLRLIKRIREENEQLPVIVISGYDEFSYAREAIRMGVREYLLKPFLPKDLFEVLEKTGAVLAEQDQLARNIRTMSEQIEEGKRFSRERFLKLLLEEKSEEKAEEAKRLGAELGIPAEDAWYCAAAIKREPSAETGGQVLGAEAFGRYLHLILENYFSQDIGMLDIPCQEEQAVLVFWKKGKSRRQFEQELRIGMEKICLGMEQHHKIRLKCAVGNAYDSRIQLSASCRESLDTLRACLDWSGKVVSYAEAERQREEVDAELEEVLTRQILLSVRMGKTEEAKENLAGLLRYYAEFSVDHIEYISVSLVKLVLDISDAAAEMGDGGQAWKDERVITYLKRHFTYGSLMEAKEVLEEYIEKCCMQRVQGSETYGCRLVRNAKAIIDHNLGNEAFGLENLAEELHFSPNYVRQLFKNKTGISFSEYLIQKRMEMAEQLLDGSNCKVREVAERAGYSSQRYFARCFKKYYGCTPSEYRGNQE